MFCIIIMQYLIYNLKGEYNMKAEIHPNYHEVEVQCACGAKFITKSACEGDVLRVEICSKCHPFYTGKKKLVDTAGRVEKFKKKHNIQ